MTAALRPLLATRAVAIHTRPPLPTDTTTTGDIDWIAIERAITGDTPRPTLTAEERLTATLLLVRAGWTEAATAQVVGVDKRQIARWKFEHGIGGSSACREDECDDIVKARGLCDRHYRQQARQREAAPRPPRKPREPARCGTRAGYKRHSRKGTPFCDACRAANTEHTRELTRRRAEQQTAEVPIDITRNHLQQELLRNPEPRKEAA
ncbi:hypothetical protein ACFVZH_02490 [Streptomyces sp. NPDC059534]|uniref:hypothetical protein n=1 Tax=Streptomyces sp. NPDC059534 TaxID=3346859 RepID=UPI0036790BE9